VIASRSSLCPGVAPGVRLLDVKVARANGSTSPGWLAKGVDAALNLRADVFSISFGLNHLPVRFPNGHGWMCPASQCILCRAVEHAVALGAIVVAAAGNEHLRFQALRKQGAELGGGVELLCPGRARAALTVGALRKEPRRRLYAQTSRDLSGKPEVLAPGIEVTSTIPTDGGGTEVDPHTLFGIGSGTSVATAVVAGGAALVIESLRRAGQPCTPSVVRRALLGYCIDSGELDGTPVLNLARLDSDPSQVASA
jgi:subtilisin family serine protease